MTQANRFIKEMESLEYFQILLWRSQTIPHIKEKCFASRRLNDTWRDAVYGSRTLSPKSRYSCVVEWEVFVKVLFRLGVLTCLDLGAGWIWKRLYLDYLPWTSCVRIMLDLFHSKGADKWPDSMKIERCSNHFERNLGFAEELCVTKD